MGTEYTFYDYIDADNDGSNVINSWLRNDGSASKAFFDTIIPHLEELPPPWMTKYTQQMKGGWKGFIEIRKTGNVQYRLLGQMRGRDIYLVACAIHKAPYYSTTVTPNKALLRIEQMDKNPTKYRGHHDYK